MVEDLSESLAEEVVEQLSGDSEEGAETQLEEDNP